MTVTLSLALALTLTLTLALALTLTLAPTRYERTRDWGRAVREAPAMPTVPLTPTLI